MGIGSTKEMVSHYFGTASRKSVSRLGASISQHWDASLMDHHRNSYAHIFEEKLMRAMEKFDEE